MIHYLVRRTVSVFLLMVLVTTIIYTIIAMSPGGLNRVFPIPPASPFTIARERSQVGLDQSPARQYFTWMGEILRGNLGGMGGPTRQTGIPLSQVLKERIRISLNLLIPALLFSVFMGLCIGLYRALKPRSIFSRFLGALSLMAISIPDFALGLLLILFFAVHLGWLPIGGPLFLGRNLGPIETFLGKAKLLVLPVLTLSTGYIAIFSEQVKTSISLTMKEDYVRTARSKGLRERTVLFKHALRNSLLPILASIFASFPFFFSSLIIVERLFNWSGLGALIYQSAVRYPRDFYVVLMVTGLVAFLNLFGSLIADFLYSLVDPRIRTPLERHRKEVQGRPFFIMVAIISIAAFLYYWRLTFPLQQITSATGPLLSLSLVCILGGVFFSKKQNVYRGSLYKNFSLPEVYMDRKALQSFLRALLKPGIITGLSIILLIAGGHLYYLQAGYESLDDIPINITNRSQSLSRENLLGTDYFGRSILTVVLVLARESVGLVSLITLIAVAGGVLFGVGMGYMQGAFDGIAMLIFNLISSVPSFFLVFLAMGIITDLEKAVMAAVSIIGLVEIARIVRARILSIRSFQFVEAAEALGNSRLQILAKHLVPGTIVNIWGQGLILFGRNMILLSSLGYLQVIRTPTWGFLAGEAGRDVASIGPIIMIFLTVLSVYLVGKGVLSAIDSSQR